MEDSLTDNTTIQNGPSMRDQRVGSSAEFSEHDEHIHAVSEQYESLDYEVVENQLYKVDEKTPNHQYVLFRQSMNRWVVCFLIGVLTALVACFIDIMVHYSSALKFSVLRKLFHHSTKSSTLYFPLMAWWAFNCGFVAIASALVVYVAGPVAAGSGIPQIKCFLNGVMIPGVVRLKTLVAKAAGVACSVAGGLSVGKEGPMIHSGAVVAAGISQGRCISIPCDFKVFEYFRSDREKRDFVSAGAAAGVSAAFGAPIGGVLFSLEEGASFWNQSLTWRTFFGSMVSMFTLSFVLSAFYGKAGQLSWSGLANFGTFEDAQYKIWELAVFLLIGAMGGLSGALFNQINYKLSIFRMNFFVKPWQKFLEALLVASVSGTVAFLTIYMIEDCHPLGISHDNSSMLQLWCPDGQYSAVAEIYFRSPEEGVKTLFHSPPGAYRPETLAVFAVGYFLLSTWTYGLSVPSGLFIPTLLTGAAWGRLVGIGVKHIFPDQEGLDPGKYALAGAAAQLGGVVRMTISLCAIIIEATHNITFGLPIMLILMMAKWVGDYFNEGLYDIHIELAEVPLLGWHAPRPAANILAEKVMNSNVILFECVEKVGKVYRTLIENKHHGYPVVDNDSEEVNGRLNGLILRSQLITLLQHRMFTTDAEGINLVSGARLPQLKHFRDAHPKYNVRMEHLGLSDEDKECWMDLRPYMNPQPYRVEVVASLPSIYQLFRGLGLRNLVVVDRNNRVRGMITRKDLARFKEVRHRNKYRVKEIYISAPD